MPVDTKAAEYAVAEGSWLKCRDAFAGQSAVQARGADYVPRLDSQTSEQYVSYLSRGLYFNAMARTVNGLLGACFRRSPQISAGAADEYLADATLTDVSFGQLAKTVMSEVLTVGRCGLLCDFSTEESRPYLSPYTAENIINWRLERLGGRSVTTMVVLAEAGHVSDAEDMYTLETQERIRVLSLDDGRYTVRLYVAVKTPTGRRDRYVLVDEVVPTIQGQPLDYIPMVVVNANSVGVVVERPPLMDVVNANLYHWRLSCDYAHGLHYTGLPTAIAAGFPKSNDGYTIGPGTAWWSEASDAKAYYLEFSGQGLGEMREAMSEAEAKMAALGGRLLEKQKHAAEAAAAIRLRTAGDQATLAGIVETLDRGLTQAVGLLNAWVGASTDDVDVRLNKDFFGETMTADEAVKLMQIVQGGYMSIENLMFLYDRGELLRPGVSPQDEREILELQGAMQSVLQAEG